MTKVKVEEITLQYNAKASVQAGSTIDLSLGSCDIVVTAETVKPEPIRSPTTPS